MIKYGYLKDGQGNKCYPFPYYEIGDICITSTNTNPSSKFGYGTWKLVDKDFIELSGNFQDWFNATSNVTIKNFYIIRSKNTFKIRLDFVNEVALTDSTITFGTIDYEALGVSNIGFSYNGGLAMTDGGGGIIEMALNYLTGVLTSIDVVTKTSGGQIPANSSISYLFDIIVNKDRMLDSACDKFYWKRTA